MSKILFSVFGMMIGVGPIMAQEAIPSAEPLDEGPLVADPQKDALSLADMMYQQSQSPEVKNNPAEFQRMVRLAAEQYANYAREFPRSPQALLALYRSGMCWQEIGMHEIANELFKRVMQGNDLNLKSAAAYRLANFYMLNADTTNAIPCYLTVIQTSPQDDLKVDAQYRLGRIYMSKGDSNGAEVMFNGIISNPKAPEAFQMAALLGMANIRSSAGKFQEAYDAYKKVLALPNLDIKTKGSCLLQAAALAAKLKKESEAQALYSQVLNDPAMKSLLPEAQLGMLMGLYVAGKYEDVLKEYERTKGVLIESKEVLSKRDMLMGQTCQKLKKYDEAINFFSSVEKLMPHTEMAMKSAFLRLVCYRDKKDADLPRRVQGFLNLYTQVFPTSEFHDLARLMAAESLVATKPAEAVLFYNSINFDKIDESIRPEIMYKSAWAASQSGNRELAIKLYTILLEKFPKNKRVGDVYAARGEMFALTGKEGDALADFDTVIKNWPKTPSAAVAWQRSAQIYQRRQDVTNMGKYYEGLLKNFPDASPAALAEARFAIGRAGFDQKDYQKAIDNLTEAKTLNADKYKAQVNLLLVLSYHQLQNAEKLKSALQTLREQNPESIQSIPNVVPAWLGMQCYVNKDFEGADVYLSWATQDDELKTAKKVIWRDLAKVRLALKQYERALKASDNFLAEETQPYRRADGLLDRSMILLGLGKYEAAKKDAETALGLGVEGPLMASLKIVLGDVAYAEKKFDEAAKNYGLTAELFVNDAELKPLALYKASMALEKAGRKPEAAQYRDRLKKEFPEWKPTEQLLPPVAD